MGQGMDRDREVPQEGRRGISEGEAGAAVLGGADEVEERRRAGGGAGDVVPGAALHGASGGGQGPEMVGVRAGGEHHRQQYRFGLP